MAYNKLKTTAVLATVFASGSDIVVVNSVVNTGAQIFVNVAEFANVQLPENIIQTTDGSMFTYGGALARPGGSENGDCGCDGSDSEGSGDGGHDPVIASCAGTFTITGNGSAIVRVDGNMSRASSQLSTRGNLPVGHTFSYDFGETGQNYNACVVAIATAADQAMNGQPTCGNANSVTIPNLFGRSTVSLPYFQQCQAASSQQSITTPRRVTTAVAAAPVIPHKNVVMVVADMVENSDAMNVSTTFCDGNDPYNGQSVVGTYSADSFDEFYQGREGVRERYGLSQLDLLTHNTPAGTAFFNGIENRRIETPVDDSFMGENDVWNGAHVNENAPMEDGSARMSPYEQELISRGLMAALVHLDHLDNEQTNGVYRVYATLGQDILADDAQTVLFAEGSPAYLAEQGGVDLGEVSVNAPMFVNPEDATNARFSDEQEANMAAIQFAQGDMARAMELDPNGFTAPEGDCGCAQTAAAEMSTTDGAVVTNLPAQQAGLMGQFNLLTVGGGLVGGVLLLGGAALARRRKNGPKAEGFQP